jgi:hypothetical protein
MGLRGCASLVSFSLLTTAQAFAQQGNGALIFCHDGTTCDADTFHQLANVLSNEGAAPVNQVRELPQSLSPYRMLFAMAPVSEFSPENEQRLVSFYAEGGYLVLASEAVGYSAGASSSFNRITTQIGYGLVFQENSFDSLCIKYGSPIAGSPITAGVNQIMYAYSTTLTGALEVVAQGESGQVLIAAGERLIAAADTNPFSDYCGTWPADGNTRLVRNIWATAGISGDYDQDGIRDAIDNCPYDYNPDQSDGDGNGVGDACDPTDSDGDGWIDVNDNCRFTYNPDQSNLDGDSSGDLCDDDIDGDRVLNASDNCYTIFNPGQEDLDRDFAGDACDGDMDNDGLPNVNDPCPYDPTNLCVIVGGAGGVGGTGGSAGVGASGGVGATGAVGATGGFAAVGATSSPPRKGGAAYRTR